MTQATAINETFRPIALTELNRHDTFLATVTHETTTGCILQPETEIEGAPQLFAYGNYRKGDKLCVAFKRRFDNGRLPLFLVERVVSYAADRVNDFASPVVRAA